MTIIIRSDDGWFIVYGGRVWPGHNQLVYDTKLASFQQLRDAQAYINQPSRFPDVTSTSTVDASAYWDSL